MPLHAAWIAAVALVASPAWASDADAVTAEHLFSEARTLMAEKRFAEACPKLETSQRLDPGGGTLLNLASCYEALGRTASAWVTYREAEGEAERAKRPEWRKTAHTRAEALVASLSRLRIVPPTDATDLAIERDGKPLDPGAYGEAVPVDPGTHEVSARAPGRTPWRTRVEVDAKKSGVVVVTVPSLARTIDATPRAASPTQDARSRPASAPDPGAARRTLGFVVGGAGLAAVVAGAVVGLVANGTYRRAVDEDCRGNAGTCDLAGLDRIGRAHTQAAVSTVLFVAGGVAVASGAVLVLTSPRKKERVAVGASTAPGSSMLFGEGRF